MSMQDPISDMITRIRNAGERRHPEVLIPASKHKQDILNVLQEEGYINGSKAESHEDKPFIRVGLKYHDGAHVISKIKRVSRPSIRRYADKDSVPRVLHGLGCAVVTTSKGVMSDRKARELGVGGEVICTVE